MSLTVRILIALVAGLVCGIAIAEWGGAWDAAIVGVAQPIGKAWLGGLQMPLIPLIFALLVTGIAQAATTARNNGLAGRAIGLFAILLVGAASVAALTGPLLLTLWPVPEGAVGALVGAGPVSEVPDVRPSAEWLLGFIPVNPLKSAADGQVVAIVLFALIFGFAAAARPAPGISRVAATTGPTVPRGWHYSPSDWFQRVPIIVLAFIGVLVVALVLSGLVNTLIGRLIEKTGLSGTDRMLGGIFGLLRGVAIVAVVVLIAGLTRIPGASWWQQSQLIAPFETAALQIVDYLPPDLAKNFSY